MTNQRYLVTVKLPDNVPIRQMAQYIREAIRHWKGGLDPTDMIAMMPSTAWTVKPYGTLPYRRER